MPADLFILTNDMSVQGGTQGVVEQVALNLNREQKVRLVTLDGSELAYPSLEVVPITSLGSQIGGRRSKTTRIPGHAWRLASLISQQRPRGVLSFLARANLVNVVAKQLTRHQFQCVISERNFNSIQYSHGLEQKALLGAMRILYRRADVVVANSSALADDLRTSFGVPPQRVTVVPNPVDVQRLRALATEPVDPPGITDASTKWLLYAGRLNEQKNPILLLRAFKRVRDDIACKLLIAGDGPMRREVEEAAIALGLEDDVNLLGWVQNPYPLMSRATAMVLPSNYEGSANALLEAMALGCPVVATDSPGGSRETLLDGRAGLLVPPRDEDALVTAIKRVLQHDGLRETLAEEGRSAILAYSPDTVVQSFRRLMDEGYAGRA